MENENQKNIGERRKNFDWNDSDMFVFPENKKSESQVESANIIEGPLDEQSQESLPPPANSKIHEPEGVEEFENTDVHHATEGPKSVLHILAEIFAMPFRAIMYFRWFFFSVLVFGSVFMGFWSIRGDIRDMIDMEKAKNLAQIDLEVAQKRVETKVAQLKIKEAEKRERLIEAETKKLEKIKEGQALAEYYNILKDEGISKEQIEIRKLEIIEQILLRWDGADPEVFKIIGDSLYSTPVE